MYRYFRTSQGDALLAADGSDTGSLESGSEAEGLEECDTDADITVGELENPSRPKEKDIISLA